MKSMTRQSPLKRPKITDYHISRRKMIKGIFALGVFSQLPLGYSCISSIKRESSEIFTEKQRKIVSNIQQILFPDDDFGPGSKEIAAEKYLEWVLSDTRMDPEDRAYIYDGLKWVDETANEKMKTDFHLLKNHQQEKLIRIISRTDWGESWLSTIMTYILEALLADPQYGGNPDGKGWKWLSHYPGYPRPTEDLLYGNILNTLTMQYGQGS